MTTYARRLDSDKFHILADYGQPLCRWVIHDRGAYQIVESEDRPDGPICPHCQRAQQATAERLQRARKAQPVNLDF